MKKNSYFPRCQPNSFKTLLRINDKEGITHHTTYTKVMSETILYSHSHTATLSHTNYMERENRPICWIVEILSSPANFTSITFYSILNNLKNFHGLLTKYTLNMKITQCAINKLILKSLP